MGVFAAKAAIVIHHQIWRGKIEGCCQIGRRNLVCLLVWWRSKILMSKGNLAPTV